VPASATGDQIGHELCLVDVAAKSNADTNRACEEITVCICTYRRLELLKRLLEAVAAQRTDGMFTFSCVVVDNDEAASARSVVDELQRGFPTRIQYVVEPVRNFALVRNRALSLVTGQLVAFIDDDEVPNEDWLIHMLRVLRHHNADAVLGPVRPYFETQPPSWIKRGRICERPSYPTGTVLHWSDTRTGNVLMRRAMVSEDGVEFDPAFASGGEDVDFFKRAARKGKTFVWCEEAPAYELVPEARMRRRYHLKRALLQGRLSLEYATERSSFLGLLLVGSKAFVAAAIYTLALPFLFLIGDHVGMKYLIKDCHHVSRLLALFGLPHSVQRDF